MSHSDAASLAADGEGAPEHRPCLHVEGPHVGLGLRRADEDSLIRNRRIGSRPSKMRRPFLGQRAGADIVRLGVVGRGIDAPVVRDAACARSELTEGARVQLPREAVRGVGSVSAGHAFGETAHPQHRATPNRPFPCRLSPDRAGYRDRRTGLSFRVDATVAHG
jgi:hypothetical protein